MGRKEKWSQDPEPLDTNSLGSPYYDFLDTYYYYVDRNCPIITERLSAEPLKLQSIYDQSGKLIDIVCDGSVASFGFFGDRILWPSCQECELRKNKS